jgi:DNA-directed RNA polymerase subunit E'/Rpb7
MSAEIINTNDGIVGSMDEANQNYELYKTVILTDSIFLKPKLISSRMDETILDCLRKKVEGKCIEPGYVLPDTVSIISRTLGMNNPSNFEGVLTYNIKYSASVCNPAVGQIVICQVADMDKSQIVCYIHHEPRKSPLEIYLPKQNHIGVTEYMMIKIGDIIKVKIAGSKFSTNETQITCIGEFVSVV